ncbi:MAG TPA: ABC transporter ATP-binding protein [Gemmatimonas sp.]|nr:ABC transporter ATP-binding protein [Gemmatimonas sp.]
MIRLRNVSKSFPIAGGKSEVLRSVSLDIAPGEFVTIMGPSGAGKSTILAVLGMLDHQWTGEYQLHEHVVNRIPQRDRMALHRKYVGFVFQQYHLLDDLTVAENLDVPLSYRDIKKAERQALVADTLDRFGIVGKKDLFPSQLSGGQQQLVGIARAVIHKPSLLLADEPTGNLHSAQGRSIMELFQRLNAAGTTVIQVTHSEENATYGSRVLQMKDGEFVGSA